MVRTHGQDAQEQRVIDDIARVGWHLVAIAEDEEGPGFVYSIGLHHTLGQPEIVIVGLKDLNVMLQILNSIGEEMLRGERFQDWCAYGNILEGHSCLFRTVDEQHYRNYFGYAQWYYQTAHFPVLQCIWPDVHGRFPWDPEFPEALRSRQPVLAAESDWPFVDPKNTAVFTTRLVLEERLPILFVSHDDDDGAWQFLCGITNQSEDARIVSLENIVTKDPSILELAELPLGWCAERADAQSPWSKSLRTNA